MRITPAVRLVALVLALLAAPARAQETPSAGSFRIAFDAALQPDAYSGRVYIVLARAEKPEPRLRMGSWFGAPQVFSLDTSAIAPGGSVTLGPDALAFPKRYADADPGELFAQAVARRSIDSPNPGSGPGDLYSDPVKVSFRPADPGTLELKLTHTVAAHPFRETDRVKLFEIVSPSLSAFYGREFKMRAGVVLPEGWTDDASTHHPTLYFIGGFGGDHHSATAMTSITAGTGKDVLLVVPDPTCYRGHSVFADSANNGPWGKALTEELIPALEARFHGSGGPQHRYVTGISSGGWSSLWLQVAYPDTFSGCWSHCPDPVDFRDFQRIDLYAADANMYRDEKGQRRPLARRTVNGEDRVTLWYDDFVRQETVMGPGGQIHSFEAVFSPRGADGQPRPLFSRTTGAIDPETAKAWEAYDIRLVLERNWPTLGPNLKGKLHIFAGSQDNFYLDGAARLLKESLEKLGSDAEFTIVEGMGHNIHRPGMESMFKQITAAEATPQGGDHR
jgi:S-formylglutathione hydrolase FrmB